MAANDAADAAQLLCAAISHIDRGIEITKLILCRIETLGWSTKEDPRRSTAIEMDRMYRGLRRRLNLPLHFSRHGLLFRMLIWIRHSQGWNQLEEINHGLENTAANLGRIFNELMADLEGSTLPNRLRQLNNIVRFFHSKSITVNVTQYFISELAEVITSLHSQAATLDSMGHLLPSGENVFTSQLAQVDSELPEPLPGAIEQTATHTIRTPVFMGPHNAGNTFLDLYFLRRVEPRAPEEALRRAVLRADSPPQLALAGVAGVGKTTALWGIAHDVYVKKKYRDGIFSMVLGCNATVDQYMESLQGIFEVSCGTKFLHGALSQENYVVLEAAATKWFTEKSCLLLLDDAREDRCGLEIITRLSRVFDVEQRSCLVFTTRDVGLASRIEQVTFSKQEPKGFICHEILRTAADFTKKEVEQEPNRSAFERVLTECSGLPSSIVKAGKTVASFAFTSGYSRSEVWMQYLNSLQARQHLLLRQGTNDITDSMEIEAALRSARVKQSQCFVVILGGGGRGKTSTVRSLRGMRFVHEHRRTELASLSRLRVVPGGRHLSEEELEQIALNSESLEANLSRVTDFFEDSLTAETAVGVSREGKGPAGDRQARTRAEVPNESTVGILNRNEGHSCVDGRDSDWDYHGDIQRSPCEVKPVVLKQDFSSLLDRTRTALDDEPVPIELDGSLVQCWDLGGQDPYVMAHALFLGFGNVFIFVVNLLNLRTSTTRKGEIQELCRWMQLVYVLSKEPEKVRPIIVGTRKGACGEVDGIWKVLRDGLKHELGDAIYDCWVKRNSHIEESVGWPLPFVAIENSNAIDDPVRSGLQELEEVVNLAAICVVDARGVVPARWVALVEELEKIKCVFLTKKEVSDIVDGFPGFDTSQKVREEDAMNALRYYRGLGRLVLFEMPGDEFVIFPDPSVVVDFVRKVTGPEELVRQRLGRRNAVMLDRGILSRGGLAVLWEGYPVRAIPVMLDLLCRFDILMRLQGGSGIEGECEELIAIPALLPSGLQGFKWSVKPGETELHIASHFNEALPPGLVGSLIAYLHRTIGGERTRVGFLRSNAVILSARVESSRGRIVVAFLLEQRRVAWTVRSEDAIRLARSCMRSLEGFLNGPLRWMKISRRHMVTRDCKAEPYGCSGTGSVEFEVPRNWIQSPTLEPLERVTGYCLSCDERWEISELMSEESMRAVDDDVERPVRLPKAAVPYDVFISHAGSDKQSAAYPLYQFLEAGGIRCFLDEEGIEVSRKTTDAQLYAAMRGSKAAVFILSADFIGRKWPMRELQEFLNLVDRAEVEEREGPLLLPLFYKLRVDECKNESLPHMEGYEAQFWANGFFDEERQDECSTEEAMEAVRRLTRFPGLRNDEGESEKEFAGRVGCRLFKFFSQ